ncbi:uncharacterized protein ACIB01_011850 [Guaruba guarouba]
MPSAAAERALLTWLYHCAHRGSEKEKGWGGERPCSPTAEWRAGNESLRPAHHACLLLASSSSSDFSGLHSPSALEKPHVVVLSLALRRGWSRREMEELSAFPYGARDEDAATQRARLGAASLPWLAKKENSRLHMTIAQLDWGPAPLAALAASMAKTKDVPLGRGTEGPLAPSCHPSVWTVSSAQAWSDLAKANLGVIFRRRFVIPKHRRRRNWEHLLKRLQAPDLEGFVTGTAVLPAAPVCACGGLWSCWLKGPPYLSQQEARCLQKPWVRKLLRGLDPSQLYQLDHLCPHDCFRES